MRQTQSLARRAGQGYGLLASLGESFRDIFREIEAATEEGRRLPRKIHRALIEQEKRQ